MKPCLQKFRKGLAVFVWKSASGRRAALQTHKGSNKGCINQETRCRHLAGLRRAAGFKSLSLGGLSRHGFRVSGDANSKPNTQSLKPKPGTLNSKPGRAPIPEIGKVDQLPACRVFHRFNGVVGSGFGVWGYVLLAIIMMVTIREYYCADDRP